MARSEVSAPRLTLTREQQLEQERMRQVLLLLDHMLRHERATVVMIINCLYDVGSINLINNKVQFRPLNHVLKWIAAMSKPVFRVAALYWLTRNCPRLITEWLHSQVQFPVVAAQNLDKTTKQLDKADAGVLEVQPVPVLAADDRHPEMLRLRSQVRRLTGLLVGAIAILGSTTIWLGCSQPPASLQFIQFHPAETVTKPNQKY